MKDNNQQATISVTANTNLSSQRKESVISNSRANSYFVPSVGRQHSVRQPSVFKDARSQKESNLVRDIKTALKQDAWPKITELMQEWEYISSKDILAECAIQLLSKDQKLCEKTLEHVIKRGPLKNNEYIFCSAMVHHALNYSKQQLQTEFDGNRHESRATSTASSSAADQFSAMTPSVQFHGHGPTPATREEWVELKDWTTTFLVVVVLQTPHRTPKDIAEALHLLDTTSNYQLVLRPNRFAFITLLKAKCFCELGQLDEALNFLNMRQSQEDALLQLNDLKVTKSLDRPESGSTRNRNRAPSIAAGHAAPEIEENQSDTSDSIIACHDLHMLLLEKMGKEEDAKELFKDFKADGSSKRPLQFKDFVKKTRCEDAGNFLIESWSPKPGELSRRL
ncbi:hypothetical protein HK100_004530 [Physocladia obscura]|uniref:Uncharacterized protein n=1 Tax=Physocladia obscura TaxID=109957 RepID=A0AAD5T6D2_9FUNG|nr:hypothetical protein HK100_004530 [Physocladia obscura]